MSTEYKPCQIDLLARAMYQKECDYVGPNHDQFCIEQNRQVLQPFEDEIERLTAEVLKLKVERDTFEHGYDETLKARLYLEGENSRLTTEISSLREAGKSLVKDNTDRFNSQKRLCEALRKIAYEHDNDGSMRYEAIAALESVSGSQETKDQKRLENDKRLLDYLVAEKLHDHPRALFRRNMPITRGSISAARYEFPQVVEIADSSPTNKGVKAAAESCEIQSRVNTDDSGQEHEFPDCKHGTGYGNWCNECYFEKKDAASQRCDVCSSTGKVHLGCADGPLTTCPSCQGKSTADSSQKCNKIVSPERRCQIDAGHKGDCAASAADSSPKQQKVGVILCGKQSLTAAVVEASRRITEAAADSSQGIVDESEHTP